MPFMSTMGAFRQSNQNTNQVALSSTYVRTIQITGVQATQWQLVSFNSFSDRNSTIDSSGNLYMMSTIFPPGTGVTNGLTINISKYTTSEYLSIVKEFAMIGSVTSGYINSMNILTDGGTVYVAVSYTYSLSRRMALMALDSNLNIVWQKTYSMSNVGGSGIYIAKDPATPYLYITLGSSMTFIFNTSGVLLNSYDTSDLELPLIPFLSGQSGGPLFVNGNYLCGGRAYAVLDSSLTALTPTSATKRTLTTANVQLTASTYDATTGYIYGTYYNSSTQKSGVFRSTFTGGISLKYEFTFSAGTYEFTGITSDGTNVYVTGIDPSAGDASLIMVLNITTLAYIDSYKVTSATGAEHGFIPIIYSGYTYAFSNYDMWVQSTNFSIPPSGTTFVVNGITYTKTSIFPAPTQSAGTLAFTPGTATISTITPTIVTGSITSTVGTDRYTFTGL